jgi:hypothetical protein
MRNYTGYVTVCCHLGRKPLSLDKYFGKFYIQTCALSYRNIGKWRNLQIPPCDC